MTVSPSILSKLSKLMRMQDSSNPHEAANAANFLEKLCEEHGINPSEIDAGYDPAQNTPEWWYEGGGFKRRCVATSILIGAVANYFDGSIIISWDHCTSQYYFKVFGTAGKKAQISLYFQYLHETMEKLSRKAKRDAVHSTGSYRTNFKKAFACEISSRLKQMKKLREEEVGCSQEREGLVRLNQSKIDQKAVGALVSTLHPHLKSAPKSRMGGSGVAAGRAAASGVGLNTQMSGRVYQLAGA